MADTYTVERSTTINASPSEVYSHMNDFHNWTAWSPWEELDPDMSKTFSGADSGVGARYAWTGNRKVGQGSMEITDAKQDAEILIDLEFLKPFKASNKTVLTL
ncbi:MAG: SRPBCC family protein, partial [Acidimicrobiia bacterium]